MTDLWTTVAAERGALAGDLGSLTDDQWQTPSLCARWTVRQVLAHLTATASLTPPTFIVNLAKAGFNFGKFSDAQIARRLGADPAATMAAFRAVQHSTSSPPGPKTSWLGEVIVHSQDIRRPLGIAHSYPADALRQVADFYSGSNALIGSKNRIAGLRLTATDQDWSHGDGDSVEGPMLSLLMAMTGRARAYDDLTGPGVTALTAR
ncbi:MAG: maleylpyruvate isomerase family mycothiol-dependent enzyme [Actinomycetota bacterium]|nr:maleylpyruvate isomerase family mycothiol-dependent enzyme [Actinomycetota bacterium]